MHVSRRVTSVYKPGKSINLSIYSPYIEKKPLDSVSNSILNSFRVFTIRIGWKEIMSFIMITNEFFSSNTLQMGAFKLNVCASIKRFIWVPIKV